MTCAAPARFNALAQASTVAPVVNTSSMSRIEAPFSARVTTKAPATVRLRSAGLSPRRICVRLDRTSVSASSVSPRAAATRRAISSA